MSFIYQTAQGIRTQLGSLSWGPAVSFSRSTILGLFQYVQAGQVKVTFVDGESEVYGQETPEPGMPTAELKVVKDTFWVRMLLFADMVSMPGSVVDSSAHATVGFCRELHAGGSYMSQFNGLL